MQTRSHLGVSQHRGSRNHKEELKTPYPGANKIQAEENQVTDLRVCENQVTDLNF